MILTFKNIERKIDTHTTNKHQLQPKLTFSEKERDFVYVSYLPGF